MVTINYFNQYRTFTQADFGNGVFDNWITNTYTQYKNTSPCTGVGVSTVVSQTQSIANTLTGIINTVSNLSFPSPNSPDAQEPAETPEIDLGDDVDGGTTPEATTSTGNSGSTGSGTDGSGSTGGSGGTGSTGGSGGSGGTGGGSGGSGGGNGSDPGSTDGESSGGGGSNVVGGTTGSIKSSSGGGSGNSKSSGANNQKQNALKPTVVGSSDLVAFNSAGDNANKGGKISGGYTATRWDGLKTHGFLCDYSTQMKGPNITTFMGWIKPKVTTLLSTTGSIGFEGKGSLYGSVAFGQVRNFKKVKVVYMLSGSYGHVYEQKLIGTSVIAGGMYDFKIGKAIGVKLTSLLVYSPYMQYYNDLLLKSPLVVLPSIGTNIGLTKTFKINVNFGGAYQVNSGALNYSLIIGSRIAL